MTAVPTVNTTFKNERKVHGTSHTAAKYTKILFSQGLKHFEISKEGLNSPTSSFLREEETTGEFPW